VLVGFATAQLVDSATVAFGWSARPWIAHCLIERSYRAFGRRRAVVDQGFSGDHGADPLPWGLHDLKDSLTARSSKTHGIANLHVPTRFGEHIIDPYSPGRARSIRRSTCSEDAHGPKPHVDAY